MKATKTINVKLNGLYDDVFRLEFSQDKDGNETGILTIPYVQWFSPTENDVYENVYEISGEILECIEKQFFDNNVVSIPIKGYKQIEMEDFIHQVMPEEIYNQLNSGTYEIPDDADKSIYGNMPAKINKNAKPVKAGKQSKAELIKETSVYAINDIIKSIIPEYEQIVKAKEAGK